jgi:hypothetical protein
MTPAARMAIKANGTRAAFDLAEQVTARAVEISEARHQSRRRLLEKNPDENGGALRRKRHSRALWIHRRFGNAPRSHGNGPPRCFPPAGGTPCVRCS